MVVLDVVMVELMLIAERLAISSAKLKDDFDPVNLVPGEIKVAFDSYLSQGCKVKTYSSVTGLISFPSLRVKVRDGKRTRGAWFTDGSGGTMFVSCWVGPKRFGLDGWPGRNHERYRGDHCDRASPRDESKRLPTPLWGRGEAE